MTSSPPQQHQPQQQQQNQRLINGNNKTTPQIVPKQSTSGDNSNRRQRRMCTRLRPHCNNLWSLWYGLVATGIQAYMITVCMKRFALYASLPWPDNIPSPKYELHIYLGLVGIATLVLPFFLVSSIFKIGNFGNDGFKLGHQLNSCSRELLLPEVSAGGMCSSLWRHGGPTAPVLHLISSFCLMVPKLIIEAKLIQAGILPKSAIWRTDLDIILPHRDPLVVLDFISPSLFNTSLPVFPGSSLPPLPTNAPVTTPSTTALQIESLHTFSLGSLSPEYINYAIALAIYAIRYPAVFWKTNKCFGIFFSFQLFAAAVHSLVVYSGISILYKIQVSYGSIDNPKHALLLDARITLALYALSGGLVLLSSLVLYLHGYCKFSSFINRERAKRGEITIKKEVAWGYFPHCGALCILVAAAVVYGPLLHDCAVVYKETLNTPLLACVIAAIGYLFLWVLTWLILTVKRHWTFKLRVTIGRAALRSARSIKLVTDVDLKQHGEVNAPLLVVGNGRTYTIAENSPKKAIMAVIQRTTLSERRTKVSEEQVYWLRPNRTPTPRDSPDSDKVTGKWAKGKHKVTFDEACTSKHGRDADDGDYAVLREIPQSASLHSDSASEETKLLECVQDDSVTYASTNTNEILRPLDDSPASSVLILPDPAPALAAVENAQFQGSVTPRCLRRADSGVPMDEPLPRSESVTPESSAGGSPPENSNSSETSSGVHSNSSASNSKRSNSVDDLPLMDSNERIITTPWRSLSLQRGTQPPTNASIYGYTSMPPAPNITTIPEQTVVIRRKQPIIRPKTTDLTQSNTETPYERSTNMRMTSFTDQPDSNPYPTRQQLLSEMHINENPYTTRQEIRNNENNPYPTRQQLGFCNSFPRTMAYQMAAEQDGSRTLPTHSENIINPYIVQQQQPLPPPPPQLQQSHSFPRQHSSIPTHHNGVRLFPQPAHTFVNKRPIVHNTHSNINYPHIGAVKYNPLPNPSCQLVANQDRDSANYSMASSGDSDSSYVQHS